MPLAWFCRRLVRISAEWTSAIYLCSFRAERHYAKRFRNSLMINLHCSKTTSKRKPHLFAENIRKDKQQLCAFSARPFK